MCNLSIWKEWSPAVAYTLGFAFADGTVTPSKNTLVIYQKDKGILERISAEIPADSLVYSAGSKVWRLRYTAKGLVEVLSRHGVVRNKTKLGYWPPSLLRKRGVDIKSESVGNWQSDWHQYRLGATATCPYCGGSGVVTPTENTM